MSRKGTAGGAVPIARTKERFTLWLEPQTHAALRALARERRLATSAVAETFIRAGLGLVAAEHLEGPALPLVRQIIEDATDRHAHRLATLIVRTLVEAAIDRRLTYALLNHQAGAETAKAIFTAAETVVVETLRRGRDEEAR